MWVNKFSLLPRLIQITTPPTFCATKEARADFLKKYSYYRHQSIITKNEDHTPQGFYHTCNIKASTLVPHYTARYGKRLYHYTPRHDTAHRVTCSILLAYIHQIFTFFINDMPICVLTRGFSKLQRQRQWH